MCRLTLAAHSRDNNIIQKPTMQKITNQVYYVGVNDRSKTLFEGLWPLPYGVSYNSYLINDDKVCLIDTVEADFFAQFVENIREVIGDRPIDYLVINHMEPDHSGSIALLRQYYPSMQVVGNKLTLQMISGFYGAAAPAVEVKNGDFIDLGHHHLDFYLTPMVHWPETMMTYDATEGILFSGDAFGCFGALNGGVIDDRIDTDRYWDEMRRYYSNIVGMYGTPVQNALKKLAGVTIRYICSTHGPVWHTLVNRVVGIYDRLSRYEAEEGLVICYGSMYGNTARMAEEIAQAASEAGMRNIVVYDVSKTHHSYILSDIFRYRRLVLGAPTYNGGLYHEMEVLLAEIGNRRIKDRYLGWFGSYTWAGRAVQKIGEWNDTVAHFTPVGEPVEMKQGMTAEVKQACRALGQAIATTNVTRE